ncbi:MULTISPECIES: hypothetical protein [unclassified Streptomyces]|uniref:hypothetical protein n=1 Tax=unclassified Streptomyces TaxID=2593676 RepID=UPI00131BE28F|nr:MULTISPECIES: hypothetical protein [unclassified Streptomyces]
MANELELIKRLLVDVADQAGPLEASRDRVVALARRRRRVRTGAAGLAVGCITAGVVMTIQVAEGASPRPAVGALSTQPAGVPTAPLSCTSTPPQPNSRSGDVRSCQYVGLTLEAARAQAAKEHRDLQIISQDGVNFGITYEWRGSRVTVTVVNDHVTSALIG